MAEPILLLRVYDTTGRGPSYTMVPPRVSRNTHLLWKLGSVHATILELARTTGVRLFTKNVAS